jgi:hypothetical protein
MRTRQLQPPSECRCQTARASERRDCENASNHDPTAKITQSIDFVQKDEILAGPFFARNVISFG